MPPWPAIDTPTPLTTPESRAWLQRPPDVSIVLSCTGTGDPAIHELLLQAQQVGVCLRSIGLVYDPAGSFVYLSIPDLPVDLS